jgi:hypothetical protein
MNAAVSQDFDYKKRLVEGLHNITNVIPKKMEDIYTKVNTHLINKIELRLSL